ncbi:hypothetical protein [Streptomyces sp. NPDC052701]|uniref:hypothetical protein n=1 Tax=Streptomyces sp. NPDC052701 TaxID=3155533 RepID=UPI00344AEF78
MTILGRNSVRVTGSATGLDVVLARGSGRARTMGRLAAPAPAEHARVVSSDRVGSGRSDPSARREERYASPDGHARAVGDVREEPGPRDTASAGRSAGAAAGVPAAAAPDPIGSPVVVRPSPSVTDEDGCRGGLGAADVDAPPESPGAVSAFAGDLP